MTRSFAKGFLYQALTDIYWKPDIFLFTISLIDLKMFFISVKYFSTTAFNPFFIFKKQPSFFEVFCKRTCYEKFNKLNRKTPVLESLFNKVAGLTNFSGKHLCWSLFFIKSQIFRPATLVKRDSNTGVFLWNLQDF